MTACVMCLFPPWVGDRAFADLHDAVTCRKPSCHGSTKKLDMSPLKAVAVNVIGDLAKQDAVEDFVGWFMWVEIEHLLQQFSVRVITYRGEWQVTAFVFSIGRYFSEKHSILVRG